MTLIQALATKAAAHPFETAFTAIVVIIVVCFVLPAAAQLMTGNRNSKHFSSRQHNG